MCAAVLAIQVKGNQLLQNNQHLHSNLNLMLERKS